MPVSVRAYLSPTLVLLAMDWPEGKHLSDFLGFAVQRTPGFRDPVTRVPAASDWLPNRVTFSGAVPDGQPDAPSNEAPIQKFMWWDARFGPEPGGQVTYAVTPVRGTKEHHELQTTDTVTVTVTLPSHVADGIGTYFNRAVLSSQAFERKVKGMQADRDALTDAQVLELRRWLANDLETVIPEFLQQNQMTATAVYHLTDKLWVIPAYQAFAQAPGKEGVIVYDAKDDVPDPDPTGKLGANQPARLALEPLGLTFYPRTKVAISHDKFIVGAAAAGAPAQRLLCGSANFTTGGLTSQANVLHTFESPQLAARYEQRARLMAADPTKAQTAKANDGWSAFFKVGNTGYVRSIFSPEAADQRVQIDAIVQAIAAAKRSVVFCLFTPTDAALRDACFAAADRGLMMFGLCNQVSAPKPPKDGAPLNAAQVAAIELYSREQANKDVVGGGRFGKATVPMGFEVERALFPGTQADPRVPNVVIHHKFIVIDAETADPIVFSGSANMSNNSLHNNDENLLEIRSQAVAAAYLAEGLRLFEHYRARARFEKPAGTSGSAVAHHASPALALRGDSSWARVHYKSGTPQCKARVSMAQAQPAWKPKGVK